METNDSGMKPRYLYCRTIPSVGLGHTLAYIAAFLQFAACLERTAVISHLSLKRRHNNGMSSDSDPSTYYNFDEVVYYTDKTPSYTKPISCITAPEFDMNQFSDAEIKVFDDLSGPTYITEEDNKRYRLIVLDISKVRWSFDCYMPKEKRYSILLPYSLQIRTTALQVINQMLSSNKHKGGYYKFKALLKNTEHNPLQHFVQFNHCCIRARRGDMLSIKRDSLTHIDNIKANLDRNVAVNKDTVIYLMTDERQEGFYDGLLKYYPNLFQFKDFPELKNLRYPEGNERPNNYLLYAIECQIYNHAAVKFSGSWANFSQYQLKEYYPFRRFVLAFHRKHQTRIIKRIGNRIDKRIGKSLIRSTYYRFRSI